MQKNCQEAQEESVFLIIYLFCFAEIYYNEQSGNEFNWWHDSQTVKFQIYIHSNAINTVSWLKRTMCCINCNNLIPPRLYKYSTVTLIRESYVNQDDGLDLGL